MFFGDLFLSLKTYKTAFSYCLPISFPPAFLVFSGILVGSQSHSEFMVKGVSETDVKQNSYIISHNVCDMAGQNIYVTVRYNVK